MVVTDSQTVLGCEEAFLTSFNERDRQDQAFTLRQSFVLGEQRCVKCQILTLVLIFLICFEHKFSEVLHVVSSSSSLTAYHRKCECFSSGSCVPLK